ncbi:MAG: sensor histidine kinase [Actinobacteria bacterium]|nr:MAG: sensor histidine kinase [Actinomycetota bacterium]
MSGPLARVLSANRPWFQDRRVFVDLAFAGFITVLALVDVVGNDVSAGQQAPDFLAFALVLLAGASLVWRRHAPIAVLTVVTIAMVTYWLRDRPSFLALIGLPALYAVAVHCDNRRRAWTAAGLSIIVLMVGAGASILNLPEGFDYPSAVSMLAYICGGFAVGVVIRNRERIFVDTKRRAEVAEADRLAEAQRAVAEERSRIAREMHDVVAHGMSVIAVQATAAQEIVHTDPEKAAEVLSRIENVVRESLSEMRRMLGVLRDSDEPTSSLAPQPRLGDVPRAVAQSVESGVPTQLEITGEERDLAPGVELAAFRIVQEALTNVRKHGGRSASAVVRIDFGDDVLTIEVSDDGVGASTALSRSGGGNGLIGIRERVDIYGGEFSAGPETGGGYVVRAVLPVTDARARPGVAAASSQANEASLKATT